MLMLCPIFYIPYTDSDEPNFAMRRIEMLLPKCTKSSTDTDPPSRVIEYTLRAEPSFMKLRDEMDPSTTI